MARDADYRMAEFFVARKVIAEATDGSFHEVEPPGEVVQRFST
jgi:hypothetical protein